MNVPIDKRRQHPICTSLRDQQTKQELNAGLRAKILSYRIVARSANELREEIEAIVKEKDLNGIVAYDEA